MEIPTGNPLWPSCISFISIRASSKNALSIAASVVSASQRWRVARVAGGSTDVVAIGGKRWRQSSWDRVVPQ
jgi:hypothetical protein